MVELFKKLLDALLVFFSFKTGKKLGGLEVENAQLKADEQAQEMYEKKSAEIKLQSEIHQAFLHKHGIADFDGDKPIIMHDLDEDITVKQKLTASDLQLERD